MRRPGIREFRDADRLASAWARIATTLSNAMATHGLPPAEPGESGPEWVERMVALLLEYLGQRRGGRTTGRSWPPAWARPLPPVQSGNRARQAMADARAIAEQALDHVAKLKAEVAEWREFCRLLEEDGPTLEDLDRRNELAGRLRVEGWEYWWRP